MADPDIFFSLVTKLRVLEEVKEIRERNAFLAEHWPHLSNSLKAYLMETQTTSLSLKRTGIAGEELTSILAILKDSQVTELNLHDNTFEFEMKTLWKHFSKSKLRKLDISKCDLSNEAVICLMQVLKNTHITHLDLSDNDVEFFDEKSVRKFVSLFRKSHLVALNVSQFLFPDGTGAISLIQALPHSSVTELSLSSCSLNAESWACLFSNLPATSVSELTVSDNEITFEMIQPLKRTLKSSKLRKLDLSSNQIGDKGLDLLAEILPFCQLVSLNVNYNQILGANSLGLYLRSSKIEYLNICGNHIQQDTMFCCPDFVKGTSVTTLSLASCGLGDELGVVLMKSLKGSSVIKLMVSGNNLSQGSISEFTRIIKDTIIEDVDFSSNHLPSEAIIMLGDALKGSRIKHIAISGVCKEPEGSSALAAFIARTKNTSVESLKLRSNHIDPSGAELISTNLPDTTFSRIDLSDNKIGTSVVKLAQQLSSTKITCLNLASNNIDDEGAAALAECLNQTQITALDLDHNSITSCGAISLALSIKKSILLSLKLKWNKIGNAGFEALAMQTDKTFFNYIEIDCNEERDEMRPRILLADDCNVEMGGMSADVGYLLFADKYFWKNRLFAHRFLSFFKQICPEINSGNLRFDRILEPRNLDEFLKDCIHFYKTATELPAAITVLAREDSLRLSKEQIGALIFEEFPKQFVPFVNKKIKPNIVEFIKFLKTIEEMGMIEILKPLLKEPPVLSIDDDLCIVHPFFYKLSCKYDQPACFIEPQNKIKVIKYLSKNADIEGALGMIEALCDEMMDS